MGPTQLLLACFVTTAWQVTSAQPASPSSSAPEVREGIPTDWSDAPGSVTQGSPPDTAIPDEEIEQDQAPVRAPADEEPTRGPVANGHDDARIRALEQRIVALESQLDARATSSENTTELPSAPTTDAETTSHTDATPIAEAKAPPAKVPPNVDPDRPPDYATGFHFGSYGRVVAGGDIHGRPGRDADIVARGSRLDESTYVELELRREDYWEKTGAYTRIVATMAFAHPVFHYNANFDANFGVRNLYIEETGLGLKRLSVWAGSRMYRGDDIYLLDFWPLDNLNTIGGGAAYTFLESLQLRLHAGINQPAHPFFFQSVARPLPHQQLGETQVAITNRQKFISSARLSNIFKIGKTGGIKPILYGEVHYAPSGQREQQPRQFEDLPADYGWLVGTQIGLFTGQRSTHLNLIFRYSGGLAAYGEFGAPTQLATDRTSRGAREMLAALGGNWEYGPFGLLVGGYWRSFRNASRSLDYADVDEGVLVARPTVWFGNIAGLSLEGSYQGQRRGVLLEDADGEENPVHGHVGRVGVIPFLTPAGRGNFARPHIRLLYVLTARDRGARSLYATDDVFANRAVDHYIGIGAEWWFGSTSYFRD